MDHLKLSFSVFVLFFLVVSASSDGDDDLVIRQVVDEAAEPKVLSSEDHFSLFKKKFGKVYASSEEHDYRFSVFKSNLRRARRHQKMDPSARHGVTQFSDLTRSEFRKKHLGVKGGFKLPKDANKAPILPTENLPEEFDWRDRVPRRSPAMMKANQKPKPHAPPRPLFSCGFFRRCTQSVLSPTSPHQQTRRKRTTTTSSSSSSSTSTSQSFTQWRFPHHLDQTPSTAPPPPPPPARPPPPPPLPVSATLQETFQIAELHLASVSESDKLLALQLLERVVVPDPPSDPTCPPSLMRGLVSCLRGNRIVTAKYVTKILLALCLAEGNRHVAVEAGAARAVVETAAGLENSAVERALAALELMCTTAEGAAEVRAHAMTVPAMVAVMARLAGRGREYAISILAVVYGRGGEVSGEEIAVAPAEEVARAVGLALEGDCTARGRRKGAHLLKTLEEYGRLDLSQSGT